MSKPTKKEIEAVVRSVITRGGDAAAIKQALAEELGIDAEIKLAEGPTDTTMKQIGKAEFRKHFTQSEEQG